MTVTELQTRHAELAEQMRGINDAAEAAGRQELTADEERQWNALDAEAHAVERALRAATMSTDETLAAEARAAYSATSTEYRLNEFRAQAGARFREIITNGTRSAAGLNGPRDVASLGVPLELRESITATGTTQVGAAIPVLVGDFIEPLEKGLIYGQLGIKMPTGLSSNVKYPVMSRLVAVGAAEKELLTTTTIEPAALEPKPKRLGLTATLTGLANTMTDGRLYNWVVVEIAKAIARALNTWTFQPTAFAADRSGVFVYNAATNPIHQTDLGAAPTYAKLLEMRGKVMSSGAYNDGTYAYIMSGLMYATLEGTPRVAGGERMIIENGKIGDVPVYLTEDIEHIGGGQYNATPKHIGFGRFSDLMIAQFGDMRLIIDPYTNAKADSVEITVNSHYSVDPLRAGSFAIGTISA